MCVVALETREALELYMYIYIYICLIQMWMMFLNTYVYALGPSRRPVSFHMVGGGGCVCVLALGDAWRCAFVVCIILEAHI